MDQAIFEMKSITKEFPGVKALDNVNFRVLKGKVMALLGENGAGKSTLMKIMTGVYQKTSGEMYYNQKKVEFHNIRLSQQKGISIIHQELNLIPELSVADNIFLGREIVNKYGKLNHKKMLQESQLLLDELGAPFSPKILASKLSIGHQQMVEIAKAISLNAEIIIMDEPTDALTLQETKSLFNIINKLRNEGKSIIYITHRLDEVFEISDYATILRDGQLVGEYDIKSINHEQIIELMVGRKLTEQYPRIFRKQGKKVLSIKNLSNQFIKNFSFDFYEGEIVGIAGLMGSMRTELAKTIYGLYSKEQGEILLNDKAIKINSPEKALQEGIAYVSEDRKTEGLILSLSVKENMSISALKSFVNRAGKINKKKESEIANQYVNHMSIATSNIHKIVKELSGGNQQKVSISKCLMTEPKVLILDEPTRGVDVGAKKEIYDLINTFKEKGMCIIMISSEIPEIMGMSDRIIVMHEGQISGVIDHEHAEQNTIMKYAVGFKEEII